jgi:adenosylcobinamide-phosphate synthase
MRRRRGRDGATSGRRSARAQLAAGLVFGTALDAVVPDPRRGHPVAGFGAFAGALENRMWSDSRIRGTAYWLACVAPPVAVARLIDCRSGRGRVAVVAMTSWAVLGSRSLRSEARILSLLLQRGDLPGARRRVTHLVGRDPSALDAAGIARAGVESVAENSCDAVVAPLFWGAVAGLPGLVGYRVVNTLDAMVGHHSPRYERFGWAAARLDDLANVSPARLTAVLTAFTSPVVGGQVGETVRITRRYGRQHPSPNSGWSEAAYAGALGLRLGGRNVYAGRAEDRPVIGAGRDARVEDLERATVLCAAVTAAAAIGAAAFAYAGRGRR